MSDETLSDDDWTPSLTHSSYSSGSYDTAEFDNHSINTSKQLQVTHNFLPDPQQRTSRHGSVKTALPREGYLTSQVSTSPSSDLACTAPYQHATQSPGPITIFNRPRQRKRGDPNDKGLRTLDRKNWLPYRLVGGIRGDPFNALPVEPRDCIPSAVDHRMLSASYGCNGSNATQSFKRSFLSGY